jgi:hypothetical protein
MSFRDKTLYKVIREPTVIAMFVLGLALTFVAGWAFDSERYGQGIVGAILANFAFSGMCVAILEVKLKK